MRRSIEQALARLSANVPDVGGASVGGSGTVGKVPVWTGPATLGDSDIDVPNLAYLSDLFTQVMADARYSLLGHTHSASEITDFDAAITAFGDARYFKLTDTHLDGPLDIGDVTGIAAAMLRVGGDIRASGEMDADDFVLVGGAAGGGSASALFSVSDEGVLKASAVSSINFTGGGVVASAVGDVVTVAITFDQAAADARYALLGHTHSSAEITDFAGAVGTVGNALWLALTGGTLTGALHGTTADFSGEVDADDFVLVGGSSGGGASAALFSVLDEGVLKSSAVSSINFTGAGVTASAVGDAVTVAITFDQAAADARYSLLGHTHLAVDITDAPWLEKSGGTMTGTLFMSNNGFRFADGAFGAFSTGGYAFFADGPTGRGLNVNLSTFEVALSDSLNVGGSVIVGGGLRQHGTYMARIESSFVNAPFGTAGPGIEMGIDAGAALFQGYDRTAGAYIPMRFAGSNFQFYGPVRSQNEITSGVPWWQLDTAGGSPGIARLVFGSDGSGYAFEIARNIVGTSATLFRFYDDGHMTTAGSVIVNGVVRSNDAYGFVVGNISGVQRILWQSEIGNYFTLVTAANGYAGLQAGGVQLPAGFDVRFLGDGYGILNSGGFRVLSFHADNSGTFHAGLAVLGDVVVGTNVKISSQYESSLVGLYDPSHYRGIYAMGDAYKLGAGGTTLGNLYGLFFAYDNTAYKNVTGLNLGHGFGLAAGGVQKFYCGELGMWHAGDATAHDFILS